MYAIVWEYEVFPAFQKPFELLYGPGGAWVQLFEKGAGFQGTTLIHDEEKATRYLTIDHWASKEAYEKFLSQYRSEYDTLDKEASGLTQHEKKLGGFEGVVAEKVVVGR